MEQRVPKRNEVPKELTWDLSDIYKDTAAWEGDVKKAMDLADALAAMEGRAAKDAASLLHAMDLYAECMERTYSVYSYAMMKNDEDTRESAGQELVFRAQSLNTKVSEKISFLEPEILSLPSETLASYFEKEPGLLAYRVTIRDMVRLKDHSLSKEAERLLASAGQRQYLRHADGRGHEIPFRHKGGAGDPDLQRPLCPPADVSRQGSAPGGL